MKPLPLLLGTVFVILGLFGEVRGPVTFSDPRSGSVIANFEGTINARTLTCNVTNDQGLQISTSWTLGNFRGHGSQLQSIATAPDLFSVSGDPVISHPSITYRNRLTVSRLASELDHVIVFCGGGEQLRQANFTLRIYRVPNLRDNLLIKIEENSANVPVDLHREPAGFPEPSAPGSFVWRKDGRPLDSSGVLLTFSSVTFAIVTREDAGMYTVTATNYVIGSTTQRVGTDTGSFRLDVIYGPTFESYGPTQRYVLLGDSLSLLCGTGLDSNPAATITWTAPDMTTITDNARYDLENGPEIVRLNLLAVERSDAGMWRCDVTVRSEQHVVNNDELVLEEEEVIGTPLTHSVQLMIIVPPSPPRSLSVTSAKSTSLFIRWSPPSQLESPLSYYRLNVLDQTSAILTVLNTTATFTSFNVTGLLPGVTYELAVVAVSQGGNVIGRSEPSNTVTVTTSSSVPSLICNAPVSDNGIITASWSYIHTGGLPLTNLTLSYVFVEGTTVNHVPVDLRSVSTRSVGVSNLTTGFEYTFNVTAENSKGTASVLCGPTLHAIGRPVMPTFGTLMSKPNDSEVTMTIKTVASGIDDSDQRFKFIIVPICEGVEEEAIEFPFPDYQSGQFERVVIKAVEKGGSYVFRAVAKNIFGSSEPAYSPSIVLQGGPRPLTPTKASNIDVIIGGAIGGVALIVVAIILLVIIVAVRVTARNKTQSFNVRQRHEEDL